MISGKRIAILGMGKSGQSAALIAAKEGAKVTLFDEQPADTPTQIEAIEKLEASRVQVVNSWFGRLDPEWDAVITSPGFPRNHPGLRDAVKHGIEVWSEVEFGSRIAKAPILAITGTNGKSTTTVMAWLMAKQVCPGAVLCGNISGSGYPEEAFTDAAYTASADGLLVSEISSYQLEWIHTFKPKAAAVTNITPDHFDRHPNFDDYKHYKLRLFENMDESCTAVLPEKPIGYTEDDLPANVNKVFIGGSSPTKWTPTELVLRNRTYSLSELPFYGTHNAMNAAMAYELARAALGEIMTPEAAIQGLRDYKGLEHRMELVGSRNGVKILNNSMCTNPAALITSTLSLESRQHIILGGLTKGLEFAAVRGLLMDSPHEIYLFGDRIPGSLASEWSDADRLFPTLEDAFAAAVQNAKEGEVIILSPGCASAPPFANFRDRGQAFKALAKAWIAS